MIIVDKALERRELDGNPIRVGMVGAGYMGQGMAAVIERNLTGMRLVAVANRTLDNAERAFADAGVDICTTVDDQDAMDGLLERDGRAVTSDPLLLCRTPGIEAIIECTGEVEFGARVVTEAIANGKHVMLMNAELDATAGPILKVLADRAGVVITNADGDEPSVAMNMFRFVQTIGYRPVLAGNVKGFLDHHRNPDTQKGFADAHGQRPFMVTSFADGTKLSLEATVLANATGFKVRRRGMEGPSCPTSATCSTATTPRSCWTRAWSSTSWGGAGLGGVRGRLQRRPDAHALHVLLQAGRRAAVHVLPAVPPDPPGGAAERGQGGAVRRRHHRARGGPVCEVTTMAKLDLEAGEELDGIGGYTCYGLIDNVEDARRDDVLPIGLAAGPA